MHACTFHWQISSAGRIVVVSRMMNFNCEMGLPDCWGFENDNFLTLKWDCQIVVVLRLMNFNCETGYFVVLRMMEFQL
jgi:hypothetical protein